MLSFAERFTTLAEARSPLCLGLDPSADMFRAWGLADNAEGLRRFCATVLEAADDRLAVIKPQSGFFERFGPVGMAELARASAQIRAQGALSLIDCKRGDVIGTMRGYAGGFLGADAGFACDAITVTAYLGFDALRPVFGRAAETGGAAFVVVHSSNPEGRALQTARHADGRTVSEALADEITGFNAGVGAAIGPVGAVVGATLDASDTALLDRLPRSLILAPGVGDQGACLADVGARFVVTRGRTLPSASRAILRHGPTLAGLREAIDRYRDDAWRALEVAPSGDA